METKKMVFVGAGLAVLVIVALVLVVPSDSEIVFVDDDMPELFDDPYLFEDVERDEIRREFVEQYAGDCNDLVLALKECQPYQCTFVDPLTREEQTRIVRGPQGDACVYEQVLYEYATLRCELSGELQRAYAQEFEDAFSEQASQAIRAHLGDRVGGNIYAIDGVEVLSPAEYAMRTGACAIQHDI